MRDRHCPGIYNLALYCKHTDSNCWECKNEKFETGGGCPRFPIEYIHEFGSVCRTDARKDGWILHRDGTATCPHCKKRGKHKKPTEQNFPVDTPQES